MAAESRGRVVFFGGVVALVALLAVALGAQWLDWVVELQSSPVQPLLSPDIRDDYLTGVFWAVFLAAVVWAWGAAVRFEGPLLTVWAVKAAVTLGPMLFYDYIYGVDPDGYFVNASMLGFEWQGLKIGQGTQNTQMLAWLHFNLVSTSYNAARLTFALVGLAAAFLAYRAGVICTGREDRRIFYAFALMPSILFWSSTLGKEPVTLFGVAAYAYGVVSWNASGRLRHLMWALGGVLVGVYIRAWLGPILLVPLAVLGVAKAQNLPRRLIFVTLGLAGLILAPQVVQTTLGVDLTDSQEFLYTTDNMARSFIRAGSTIEVPALTTFSELGVFAPLGMFTVLFRPFVGEVPNVFGTLAGLENALLLFLAFRAAWRTRLKDFSNPLVPWVIAAVILWAAVYSVHSFQNLGTAARHRLHIMPLFLGMLMYLGRSRAPELRHSQPVPIDGNAVVRMRPRA